TFDEARMLRFYLSLVARGSAPELPGKAPALYSSVRSPGGFELIEDSGCHTQHLFGDDGLSPQAQIHRQIYLRRGDVNFICQASGSGLTAVSLTGRPMAPLLDDFAQIVGPGAQCAKSLRPEDVADSLGSRFAVLVPGAGALCCAATDSDENAVRLVMEKAALVETGSRIVGRPRPIRFPECLLMHFIYMKSYSKMAK
ncbi:MAG: hypothetical protein P4L75_08160, partial [Clostridia bacterium]|nr:hypothetical protein [Clostridia bacterium]